MTRRFLVSSLVLMCAFATSCSTFAVAAATVNGAKITESQVESELDRVRSDPTFQDLLQRQADQLRGVARRNILTGLIRQTILDQEARRRGVRVTGEAVDRLIAQEAQRQGLSVEQFQESQNLSASDARTIGERIVRMFELRRQVVTEVDVDEDAVRDAYEAQKEAFVEVNPLRVTVRTEAEARDIIEDVEQGATLSSIARDRSIDELADDGGDIGWVPLTSLPSHAQTALQTTNIGDVTDALRTQDGFEVYRLVDRRDRPFSDVAAEIRTQLTDQERERQFEGWLARRLRSASIVVNPKYGRFDRNQLQVLPGTGELKP